MPARTTRWRPAPASSPATLLLAHTEGSLSGDDLPAGLEPMAVVALHATLRPDAAETVAYFATQAVAVKVISGDTQRTVGAVGRRAGVPGVVFGRVVPEQKRAMVTALQARGHVWPCGRRDETTPWP